MPKHGSINLYVHGNQKARQDGQPRTSTSTHTQLLNYVNCRNWQIVVNLGLLTSGKRHSGRIFLDSRKPIRRERNKTVLEQQDIDVLMKPNNFLSFRSSLI